jgi:tripartite-type tricarboxylate transporter receptor subunit TctC
MPVVGFLSSTSPGEYAFVIEPFRQGYVRAGKLRALAVTTATRAEVLPDIPAINETVPGYEASGWLGIGAPKHIPDELVKRLNQEIAAVIADPIAKARLVGLGIEPVSMAPADFQKFMAGEVEKWSKVIKFAGIKPE